MDETRSRSDFERVVAELKAAERERDNARQDSASLGLLYDEAKRNLAEFRDQVARLTRERDEWKAKAERLQDAEDGRDPLWRD